MGPMEWLTKKIVSSFSHIDLGVKFVNPPSFSLWREQVMKLHKLFECSGKLNFVMDIPWISATQKQYTAQYQLFCWILATLVIGYRIKFSFVYRLVWCWSWSLWAFDCSSIFTPFTGEGCCSTWRALVLLFCDLGIAAFFFLHSVRLAMLFSWFFFPDHQEAWAWHSFF